MNNFIMYRYYKDLVANNEADDENLKVLFNRANDYHKQQMLMEQNDIDSNPYGAVDNNTNNLGLDMVAPNLYNDDKWVLLGQTIYPKLEQDKPMLSANQQATKDLQESISLANGYNEETSAKIMSDLTFKSSLRG